MLSCSSPRALESSWDIEAQMGTTCCVSHGEKELKPPPAVFRHPLDSQMESMAGSSLLYASRVT